MADLNDFAAATGALIKGARWYRGGLSAASPLNGPLGSIEDGEYRVTYDTTAASLGLPGGRAGIVSQVSYGDFAFHTHQSIDGTSYRVWRAGPALWGSWVTPAKAYTDAAISASAASLTSSLTWYRGGLAGTAPISGPLGSIADGVYRINYDSRAAELGITGGGAGEFVQVSFGEFGFQRNTHLGGTVTRGWSPATSSWGAWTPQGGGSAPAAPATTASGMKRVPLALTLGHGGGAHSVTEGTVRFPMEWAAPVGRWRLHIRNANPREGTVRTGAIDFPQGVWVGADEGDGIASSLVQVAPAFTTATDGSEYVTGWINHDLPADSKHLLSLAYVASDTVTTNVGGSWTSPGQIADSTSGTWTGQIMSPLDVWIEAEVPQTVPVVAVIGDSLSAGTGSTIPVRDSALSQHMRAWGGLPIHYAAAGDTLNSWNGAIPGADTYKKTRWSALAKPDAVLFALGSNDIFGQSQTLAQMQTRAESVVAWAKANLTGRIFYATITPRTGVTGAQEDVRRQYNDWLRARTDTQQVFEFAAAISADDETILPEFDADGIHLTTSGYAAEAATLRYLVPAGPVYRTV